MNEEQELNIKKDYLNGLKYKELCEKYNITQNELRAIIRKYKLTRTKSNAQKGNKNAKNNKGGHAPPKNKNALVTGEYETIFEDVLDDDEMAILNDDFEIDKKKMLQKEIQLLMIREKRMMKRIHKLQSTGKDMTVSSIKDKNTKHYGTSVNRETISELEPSLNAIQRIEEGLTRITETKRRYIETLLKFPDKESDDDDDNSFIEALNGQAEEIWNEEE